MFRRTWIRWVSGLVVLVLVALAAVYAASQRRMDRRFEVTPTAVVVPSDAAALGEGLRLYFSRGCADCHGDDLGGKRVIDDLLAGMVFGANLTGGRGGLGERDDLDLVRAIRHGVAPDGRALLFMPAHEYNPLADAEIGAIIAAIRAAAPVDREAPPPRIGPLMRALFLFGEVPTLVSAEVIDHDAPRPAPPTVAPTAAYGAYLANLCVGCHGPGLSGGSIPGAPPSWPPASNITLDASGLATWDEEGFIRAMRSGTRADGTLIDPVMPWRNFSRMTDTELQALWRHLAALPPRPAGGR
jgi:mono/diheme cytochrome c family protein